MKAAVALILLAACASAGSPTKSYRMVSAVPIDPDGALATAIATVQERFQVVDLDREQGRFSTEPERIDAAGTSYRVTHVVQLGASYAYCHVVF
jgi:hypothetical protein